MRALVTGSAGFVGRYMCQELYDRGWAIREIDVVNGHDVRDFFFYTEDVYDLVVHCAYEVGGRAHIDAKNLALAHNLEIDAQMFDWAVRTGQHAVLYFSSCAAYPASLQKFSALRQPAREDDIEFDEYGSFPFDNYGWAKLTGERLGIAASQTGLRVHTVRPFSGYGGDQSLDYPFPSIVRRALQGDLSVWGPPGQFRDWIHISDIVAGALSVYEADFREPVNLCTGVGTEFGEFAKKVWYIYQKEFFTGMRANTSLSNQIPDVEYQPEKPTGSLYRVGDPTLMNSMHTAKISLEEGIRDAIRDR